MIPLWKQLLEDIKDDILTEAEIKLQQFANDTVEQLIEALIPFAKYGEAVKITCDATPKHLVTVSLMFSLAGEIQTVHLTVQDCYNAIAALDRVEMLRLMETPEEGNA